MLTAKKLLQKYSSKNNFTYYWMNLLFGSSNRLSIVKNSRQCFIDITGKGI